MTVDDALDLFAYTAWANAAVLGAAEAAGGDAWTQPLGGSFPSLQAVLAHVAGGERVWLDRWALGDTAEGAGAANAPRTFPAWTADPSPADLRRAFADVERERDAFLRTLADADLAAPRPYTLFNGTTGDEPLRDQLTHLANHGTYHRGQAVAMLRMLGAAPPSTDFIRWVRLGRPPADA